MEYCQNVTHPLNQEDCQDEKLGQSAENFQKFIYELFDKNGILTDLRAYLRTHIVNVLKNAHSNAPLSYQKHFTQRLDFTYQALNILIAEYLLRFEFSFTLSVFVSEIPLANMVFQYAKSLLRNEVNIDNATPKFSECDIWSILNYLGVKCDSVNVSNIMEMYNSDENMPLLLCILKSGTPLQTENMFYMESGVHSETSLTSSGKSVDIATEDNLKCPRKALTTDKCKHFAFCKACHNKMSRIRDKYQRKKRHIAKNDNVDSVAMTNMLQNISSVEQNLIDEMFQQLKDVYEAEVEMVKQEEEIKVNKSLATHAIQLQKHRNQLEDTFRAREAELERNINEKKKFLWGLAKNLRTQHQQMAKAMDAVKHETTRLTVKEEKIKKQLTQAEEFLRTRGEEMRQQISNELKILESQLESMKKEKDSINKEKSELEQLKNIYKDCNVKKSELNEDIKTHYSVLKDELSVLKKYIDSARMEPKSFTERSTVTELNNVTSRLSIILNNDQDAQSLTRIDSEVRAPNQVRNNLKKQKIVNFCQIESNMAEILDENEDEGSSNSSSMGEVNEGNQEQTDYVQHLTEENERLKNLAEQQRTQIQELECQRIRLQQMISSQLVPATSTPVRPRTAPTQPNAEVITPNRVSSSQSANSFGWRKGAGEELNLFGDPQPHVLVPGDTIPFIGVLSGSRNQQHRRHLLNQWRSLRRQMSPDRDVVTERRPRPLSAGATLIGTRLGQEDQYESNVAFPSNMRDSMEHLPHIVTDIKRIREKSPKSMLREAKEKLKNPTPRKEEQAARSETKRDKSPGAVLREAKKRLRKLEIEAEAVEQSYRDYRKRQERKEKRPKMEDEAVVPQDLTKEIDEQRSRSLLRIGANQRRIDTCAYTKAKLEQDAMNYDVDQYLRRFETKYGYNITQFTNNNTTAQIARPIPNEFSEPLGNNHRISKQNYVETPMSEFRNYYTTEKHEYFYKKPETSTTPKNVENQKTNSVDLNPKSPIGNVNVDYRNSTSEKLIKTRNDKGAEYEILKENMNESYNINDTKIEVEIESDIPCHQETNTKSLDAVPIKSPKRQDMVGEFNSLRIEIDKESSSTLKIKDSDTNEIMVVVNSSIKSSEDIQVSQYDDGEKSLQLTLNVSPKSNFEPKSVEKVKSPDRERSLSPATAANLTKSDVLDAIFTTDNKDVSNIEPPVEPLDYTHEDYPDDFSADVDNYNSATDVEITHSPISLPKTSEEENFWD